MTQLSKRQFRIPIPTTPISKQNEETLPEPRRRSVRSRKEVQSYDDKKMVASDDHDVDDEAPTATAGRKEKRKAVVYHGKKASKTVQTLDSEQEHTINTDESGNDDPPVRLESTRQGKGKLVEGDPEPIPGPANLAYLTLDDQRLVVDATTPTLQNFMSHIDKIVMLAGAAYLYDPDLERAMH